VKVNCLSAVVSAPKVLSFKRVAATHPIRTQMKVTGSTFLAHDGIACSSRGFRFAAQLVKTKGAKIARYTSEAIETHTRPKLKTKARADIKRVAILPQERANRLQWQTVRPRKEGEMILAWFGPIVEEAIVKLTLNKQQGTLLIWYNPQSRRFDSKGLYLYKRLGIQGKLEWRWM
jgi:hypothetical protein